MSLPTPLNWLKTSGPKYVLFGFNRTNGVGGWWGHRTPDHTQIFFDSHREAYEWLKVNHGEKGFGRHNERKAEGELRRYSTDRNEVWLPRVAQIQEWFDYGPLIAWYGSKIDYEVTKDYEPTGETKTRTENAMWWIFQMKD